MRHLILLLLNAWDGYATAIGLYLGIVSEGNVLLRDMAHSNPMNLFWLKIALVSFCITLLYAYRHKQMARYGSLALVGIYTVIATMHLITLGIV